MEKKQTLNRKEIEEIVYNSTMKLLKEGLFHRTYQEGAPKSAAEVIRGNGWDGYIADNKPNDKVIRVYKNSDAVFSAGDDCLPFEQLVEDLKIYYQDKGINCSVEPIEDYGGKKGSYIRIRRV